MKEEPVSLARILPDSSVRVVSFSKIALWVETNVSLHSKVSQNPNHVQHPRLADIVDTNVLALNESLAALRKRVHDLDALLSVKELKVNYSQQISPMSHRRM
jgi:hypothetical protein